MTKLILWRKKTQTQIFEKTQMVTKLKWLHNSSGYTTQIVTKLILWKTQNSNCDKTQNSNCDKTQKFKLGQNLNFNISQFMKKKNFKMVNLRDVLWAAFCDSRHVFLFSFCFKVGMRHAVVEIMVVTTCGGGISRLASNWQSWHNAWTIIVDLEFRKHSGNSKLVFDWNVVTF